MRTRRQNNQLELALEPAAKGEARSAGAQGTEARTARAEPERPAAGQQPSMEAVVEPGNLKKALARVRRNKGAPGVDGMTIDELGDHLKAHWPEIRSRLLAGSYTPQPVRRVEIPKASGGVRLLGVPTVIDRFIQQAVMQVLQEEWDPGFSDASYGFRPGRSAHQAVRRAQEHILVGFDIVVDLDLETFFDRVNHDILMGLVAKRVADKRLLRLVCGFLTAGVLDGGLVGPTIKGTPQGGPLSPLLSNLMLDVLDKELETRGHRFVRYADDCNLYVRSRRAGERVMASVTDFLARRLKLTSTSGHGGGFAPSSGSTGSMGAPASRRCAAGASASPWRPRPPAAPMARGALAVARRFRSRCPTPSSTESASHPSPQAMPLDSVEPPCTDPYARWCGRGGAARLPPIPIALGPSRVTHRPPSADEAVGDGRRRPSRERDGIDHEPDPAGRARDHARQEDDRGTVTGRTGFWGCSQDSIMSPFPARTR